MIRFFFLIFLTSATGVTFAQDTSHSLKGDLALNNDTDSLTRMYTHLPDSLLPSLSKIDSIRSRFNMSADSIENQYERSIADINAQSDRLNQRIDSLQRLNQPTNKYKRSIKKLSNVRQKTEARFNGKLSALKSKITYRLNAVDLPPEHREHVQKLTRQINELNINSEVVKLPELKIPGYDLPNINPVGKVPSANGIQYPVDLGKADMSTADLGNVAQQAQGYQQDVSDIAGGNLDDVQKIPEMIESHAGKIDGVEQLQEQLGIIDGQKAKLDVIQHPDQAKEKAVEMTKEAAVDHFAGKDEQLKAAMEKVSKYKQKYSSVSSIKDLPKRPPNPMRGKPFVQRLVPGLYFQYQQKNFYLLDVNPYAGYKISGRFTAGIGWNHRFAYDSKYDRWNKRSQIFGPRTYVDFTLGKGFIAHVEGEVMNSFVPSTLLGNPDAGHREWVWSLMTGIKKEYKIYKNLKGTALIQYNLFNRYYKAPYVDRLNSRIGFEYTLKQKKAKPVDRRRR